MSTTDAAAGSIKRSPSVDSLSSLSSLSDTEQRPRRSARLSTRSQPTPADSAHRKRKRSPSIEPAAPTAGPSDLRRSTRSKGKQRQISPEPPSRRKRAKYNFRAKPASKAAKMPNRRSKAAASTSKIPDDDVAVPSGGRAQRKRQREQAGSKPTLLMEVDAPTYDGDLVEDGIVVDEDVSEDDDEEGGGEDPEVVVQDDHSDSEHDDDDDDEVEYHGMALDQPVEQGDPEAHGDSPFNHFSNAMAGLSGFGGLMSGFSSRLKTILTSLRNHDNPDPTQKLVALQELTEILSISTEDTLAGYFSIDQFVKELVHVLRGDDLALVGEESGVEMMLLACRCLANLMEALPGSGHNIVAGGAVPILCAKLLEIQYIDLAEQTLSTLEKISEEVPSSIVREGGLTALLSFLDFFSTNVQRTAVTAAANCCRSLSIDSFNMVRDVVPILRNVLTYSDQRVVEQACLAVTRIIESYRHYPDKLEPLLTADLLSALVTNLLPTASPIASSTYTQLIRMLALAARASPEVAITLLEMNAANALYQILTGVAPPAVGDEITSIRKHAEGDDMVVLQNLVHRPKEQVLEALVLIAELMPALPRDGIFHTKPNASRKKAKTNVVKREEVSPSLPMSADADLSAVPTTLRTVEDEEESEIKLEARSNLEDSPVNPRATGASRLSGRASNEHRTDLFNDKSESRQSAVQRFYALILPTLIEVYSASVGVTVRAKSMLGMTKIVYLCPKEYLTSILNALPLANFLGSILASKEHSSLIISGLQLVELLLVKVPDVSHYLFRREGVLHEVEQLASAELLAPPPPKDSASVIARSTATEVAAEQDNAGPDLASVASPTRPSGLTRALIANDARHDPSQLAENQMKDLVTLRARFVRDRYGSSSAGSAQQATKDLKGIKELAKQLVMLSDVALEDGKPGRLATCLKHIAQLFVKPTKSISSFEMLESGLVDALLKFLLSCKGSSHDSLAKQTLFARIFTAQSSGASQPALAALVKRLQESLSRSEEFEVVTALQGSTDGNSASMLAKQLKLRLSSDDVDVPRSCSNIIVSIHAIATFQAFNDYLRPRISSSMPADRAADSAPMPSRLAQALAATAGSVEAGSSRSLGTPTLQPPADAASPGTSQAPQNAAQQIVRRRSSRLAKASSSAYQTPAGSPAAPRIADDFDLDQQVFDGDMDVDVSRDELTTTLERVGDGSLLEGHTPGGTRVATPVGRGAAASGSPFSSGPRASYAAALKTAPTDWHLEFFMDDREVSLDTTIYGAVHQHESRQVASTSRTMWQNVYPVKYRKVAGPASPASPRTSPEPVGTDVNPLVAMPDFIPRDSPQSKALELLRSLHSLNTDIPELLDSLSHATRLGEAAFINNKLTAKLNRQLEEPMIVASSCLPEWALDFPQSFPFLFPFESRFAFLQSTSFGYARLMQKWVGQARQDSRRDDSLAFLGRLQRQKVRLARDRLLESAFKVFELYGQSRAVLEIEFFAEVGTGLGPTLEFYALVSKEFSRKDLGMWRNSDVAANPSPYVDNPAGLFPCPIQDDLGLSEGSRKVSTMFRVLGQFVAKGLMDSRIVDVPFNRTFMKLVLDHDLPLTTAMVKTVDPTLGSSLDHLQAYVNAKEAILSDISNSDSDKAKRIGKIKIKDASVDDLSLDFTLPGFPDIALKPNGQDISVTIDNVEEYVQLVIEYTLVKGTERQVKAFRAGFSEVFPVKDLACFTADELVLVFGNAKEDWTLETLHDSIRADHGYSLDSRIVSDLLALLSHYDRSQQRLFLSFATGSPRLPVGGFKALHPPLTVVRKPAEAGHAADEGLPSVMTCQNYIKMPEYSSASVLSSRLDLAVSEGQGAFHLS